MTGSTTNKAKTRTANQSGKTRRDKNRKIRRDELRLYLSRKGLLNKVIDIAQKMGDMRRKMPKDKFDRLKAAADINLKLINKYLGDDKTLEMLNDEENPLVIQPIQYAEKK